MNLSAIVLTKENNPSLKQCLESLAFCDEIIVLQDSQEKKTLSKLPKNIHIFKRSLDNNFAAQRNFGITKAKGEWIFFIDEDEEVPVTLQQEIEEVIQSNNKIQGYYVRRYDSFLGKDLLHGETASVKLLRLAKRESGSWSGNVHEEWQIEGRREMLKNPILHNRSLTIHDFLSRINWYTDIRSFELYNNNVKEPLMMIFAKPLAKFILNYIIKLGFLDGMPGFIFSLLMSWHSLLVRVKLKLLWLNKGSFDFKIC